MLSEPLGALSCWFHTTNLSPFRALLEQEYAGVFGNRRHVLLHRVPGISELPWDPLDGVIWPPQIRSGG